RPPCLIRRPPHPRPGPPTATPHVLGFRLDRSARSVSAAGQRDPATQPGSARPHAANHASLGRSASIRMQAVAVISDVERRPRSSHVRHVAERRTPGSDTFLRYYGTPRVRNRITVVGCSIRPPSLVPAVTTSASTAP